ncbi:MAG: sigma-70 family RNA polymerase sigma factor, partial [Sedimentisphaerales bacterium]|nr:sigma-70 family RNA polymerase sigma factor [Sedimentisphaerales bacterium]
MTKNTLSDIELLKASLQGQTPAFEVIVKKYQSLICAITYSATGSVDKSEELAQQAFVKCWKNLGQLKDLTKFRSWLCSIARHVISDFYRRQKSDITSETIPMDSIQEHPSEDAGPVEAAISKEREAIVNEALSKIPETFREPLVLYYRQDRSYRQVADELGFSEHTARERISHARSLLREQVASLVEKTIERTKPGKVFTTTVIASVAGLAIKGSGVAAATGVAAVATKTGTVGSAATILSGVTAKIITAAAVVAIGVGAVVTYKNVTKTSPEPKFSQAGMIVQEQGEEQSLYKEQHNKADKSFAEAATDLDTKTFLSENTASTSQEQGTNESTNGQSNKPETAKTGISGIVIDKSNLKPIKGAEIFYGSKEHREAFCFTDANGHFEIFDMDPRGERFFYVVAKNFTSRRITLDIIKDKVYENFKIELTPGSKVAGVVYDQNDKPVKGATVRTFQFTNHPVITDANGTFEIDGLDPAWGQYSLHVTHPNYPAFSTSFSPANAGNTAWQDIVLKPGVTVYGQVTDAQGQPVVNVSVGNTTSRAMWNCISTNTDQEGKYELKNIDTGNLVLWAVTNKYAPYVERFSIDGSETKKLINIQLSDPLPLHGKIVDKEVNPVPGVSISIREYKGVSNLTNWQDIVSSDSEGKFIIPNAPSTGTVILSVWAEQVPNTHSELEAGQEEEYVIEVDTVGRVYGKVVDDKTGEPVKKFNIKL